MSGLRFALRTLSRTPVVSLVVILSLGLGIGANTAIFSLLHQALLRTLPVQNPDELVVLTTPVYMSDGRSSTNDSGGRDSVFSYLLFRGLEKHPAGVRGVAAHRLLGASISFQGRTLRGRVNIVSGGYFHLLGVQPLLGRVLAGQDDRGGGQPAAMLSYGYWQDKLGGREDVLNQPLRVNGRIFTIVGILPAGFLGLTLGNEPDVYVPLIFKPDMTPGWNGTNRWDDYYLYVFARLQPRSTRQQAEAALNSTYAGLVEQQLLTVKDARPGEVERYRKSRIRLEDGAQGASSIREQMKTPLTILMICTGLVLLIASGNAANLLLARAAQRTREISIRVAMGASRFRIIRQLLIEALALSLAGGLTGLLVGTWILDFLISQLGNGEGQIRYIDTRLDPPVLLFTLCVSIAVGVLFGIYPAWSAARVSIAGSLKQDSANSSASLGGVRLRKTLVTAQVALSVLLLIPTGLFLRSLVNLTRTDLGLRTENVLTFGLAPELNGYKPEQSLRLFERVEEELAAIPGVRHATSALVPFITGSNWGSSVRVEGAGKDSLADTNSMYNVVGPGFFGKSGIQLISGREFTASDNLSAPRVAVVNQRWANHFFPGGSPIGRKFRQGESQEEFEVVGVVKDSKYSSVRQAPPRLFFLPARQHPDTGSMSFYVHSTLPTDQLASQVRGVIAAVDPDLPITGLRTFEDEVRMNIRPDRLVFQLAAAFAILATVLAMLGLYGVMAFGVARRSREFGIRMALGAEETTIRGLVMSEVAIMLAAGVVLGAPAALGLSRFAESQLFGVKAFDPAVVLGAVAVLSLAALFAGWLPARRAVRVNPIDALRYE